jgi:hypothetical protein
MPFLTSFSVDFLALTKPCSGYTPIFYFLEHFTPSLFTSNMKFFDVDFSIPDYPQKLIIVNFFNDHHHVWPGFICELM